MFEKPKRPKKIINQDNKQPQTIQELIKRYDLDNTKIYDFLDELIIQLRTNESQNNKKLNETELKIKGTVLYESNETGTSEGSFELNDDKDNYTRLDFYDIFGNLVGKCFNDATEIYLSSVNQGTSNLIITAARLTVSDNTFSFYSNKRTLFNGTTWSQDTTYLMRLSKVIGYKED